MGLLSPRLPDFDIDEWAARSYHDRLQRMCQDWALNGFGSPVGAYVFYVLKIALYVGGWLGFMALRPEVAGLSDIDQWWATGLSFRTAVLWTLLYEVLGLGCGSGPLTLRFMPPFGGALYFLRPGTIRLPPWPRHLPPTSGDRRTLVDVALYAALLGAGFWALTTRLGVSEVLPVVILLGAIGLRDKTVFLAARAEHYWVTLIVFLFPDDLFAGAKAVQVAIWWGAASSKLNHHFPSVVAVMVSNSPFLRWRRLKRAMYRAYPNDLRPSWLARSLAHGGTVVEYLFPLLLVLADGGPLTTMALVVMVAFHLYIMSNVPLGVPIEWNVFFIYSAIVLFGVHAEVRIWSIGSPLLAGILLIALVGVPVLGNLRPRLISFLPSMRYYAGNWGTSLWLIERGALDKLDALVGTSRKVQDQLGLFYDERTCTALFGKALAFRSMHIHGRALNSLLPRAVDDHERYVIHDGEWIAGVAIGWNFGEGHLHHEQLLGAVQRRCGFEPFQLRCIFVESQPIHRQDHEYRIVDAVTGQLEAGSIRVRDLLDLQPWGTIDLAAEVPRDA